MSGTFDPYHVWLGIPPAEQPPNHYRLLGIAVFESDLDVIDHAADRQMAHVRTFQAGRNGALSQQLLNELSSARLCLLNPAKKSVYDGELRSKLGTAPKAMPVAPAAAVPKAQPVAKVVPKAQGVGVPASASQSGVLDGGPSGSGVLSGQSGVLDGGPSSSSVLHADPARSGMSSASASRSGVSQAASRSGVSQTAARSGVAQSGSMARPNAVAATRPATASSAALEIDNEAMDALTSSPDFQIRPRRRSSSATQAWKRPVAWGIAAGVLVVCFFLLYMLIKNLTSRDEWKKLILEQPTAPATSPAEPTPDK
jgi:hypothetical protein